MPSIDTFLQTAYQFIKALFVRVTKRMYRTAAVLMTGAAVVTVIAFNSVSFGGVGKNAASAHREYPDDVELTEMLQSEETTETESLSEFTILASNEESQHLLGQRLEQGIQDELAKEALSNEESQHLLGQRLEQGIQDELAKEALEVEVIEREVRMQTQQAAQEAEERERRERAVISYSDEDYSVLQKIVQAEAGVCDDRGKILVANVIINRVKNKKFPNSVKAVVYEPSQFSPVLDGTINSCKVTQQTIDCVNRALEGEDYSGGALYFMNRGISASSNVRWFDGKLTYVMQHGGHEFYK